MRVEPELMDHPKFLALKERIGDFAAEALLRLWGHCQNSQRGGRWTGKNPAYVEIVCRWKGEKGALYSALVETTFLDEMRNCLVIHDWDKFNSKARSAWDNGRRGGRPLGSHSVNPSITQPKPIHNPNQIGSELRQPTDNQRVSESVSESVSKGENNKGVPSANGSDVAASRTRFAALTAQVATLTARFKDDRSVGPELRKKRAELNQLTARQARGEFS